MNLSIDMLELIEILDRHAVPWVAVGGFAVNYYGYVRTTQDFDVLVVPSVETAEKMSAVLRDFGFGGVGFSKSLFEKQGSAIHLGVEPNRIDLLTSIGGVEPSEVFAGSRLVRFGGAVVRIIAPEHLIISKKSSHRLRDLADAEELAAIMEKKKKGGSGRRRRANIRK